MFSRRTAWDRRPTELAAALETRRAAGGRVVDLTESNPTRAGLLVPADLLEALGSAAGRRYEPSPRGLDAARQAVAAAMARPGEVPHPQRVVLTASTSEAYAFLIKLLCDPGDAVCVPQPSYPLVDYIATLEGVACERFALLEPEWTLDPDALRPGPRARAICVVSPNNPTGAYLSAAERAGLERLAARRGLAVLCDEVFADFRVEAALDEALVATPECLTFRLGGLSKSCGLPQLKLGWIVVDGPTALVDEALARLELVADSFLSVATPVQLAAPEILRRRAQLAAPILARIRSNLAALDRALAGVPSVARGPVGGGWTAVLRFPDTEAEEARAQRWLAECGVLLHPGRLYGFPRAGYYVASLIVEPDAFSAGVEAILAAP